VTAQSIDWHEECLTNQVAYLSIQRRELQDLQIRVNILVAECDRYNRQIARAKREGKESFDRERYLSK